MNLPTYDAARTQTDSSLRALADQVPGVSGVVPLPASDPYPCGEPLSLGAGKKQGVFYTGHWAVKLSPGTDTKAVLRELPANLGDGWRALPVATDLAASLVRVASVETGLSVDVMTTELDGSPALDFLATSKCAQKPE